MFPRASRSEHSAPVGLSRHRAARSRGEARHTRRLSRSASVGSVVLILTLTGGLLAACGSTTPGGDSKPGHLSVSVEPKARSGQPPVPEGRSPTLGPQAFHPSETSGVQLDMVNALRDGTPIFDGDFADPFALKTPQALYLFASDTTASRYAPAAHIPEIELT